MKSLEYTYRLAGITGELYSLVAELSAELGDNAYLLNGYVPMLISNLSRQAFDALFGYQREEAGTLYLQNTRESIRRCGGFDDRLDRLDMLVRECFCALGMKALT